MGSSKSISRQPLTRRSCRAPGGAGNPVATAPANGFQLVSQKTLVGDVNAQIEFLPLDDVFTAGGAAVYLSQTKTLFGGPLVDHGPRVPLVGSDTGAWRAALREWAGLRPAHVVPGFGTWGGAELLDRHERFLGELHRQVGYFIANGRPHEDLQDDIRVPADYLVWMPYDNPLAEDVEHVYQELTVPRAPFADRPPRLDDKIPHALVLIGDGPHEPGHVEAGLRQVFQATGVVAHFTVDVRALSAENLAHVRLLVILRDGLLRPGAKGQPDFVWMTPEQERAVVDFVERGGGFLNLHNSLGLYPENGPYLKLAAGRYVGHGPLERFRVEVVDHDHPITRGVEDFSVADEQHTPEVDADRIHLLLRNRSDDGKTAAAGWVREPGRGRLCHLANGHTRESLLHPTYQRLMRNAVLWCLRQDGNTVSEAKTNQGALALTEPAPDSTSDVAENVAPSIERLGEEASRSLAEIYADDRTIPLEARVVEKVKRDDLPREKIVFRGAQGFLVPGYFQLPPGGPGPHPCVLLLHGWSGGKDNWWQDGNYVSGGNLREALLAAGFAVLALDAQCHGDRISQNDFAPVNHYVDESAGDKQRKGYFTLNEIYIQTTRDYRRAIDYLETRSDIDKSRIGAIGYSMGGTQTFLLTGVEPRIKAAVAVATPAEKSKWSPVAPQNFIRGIGQRPLLTILGRSDPMCSVEHARELQSLLESKPKDQVFFDAGHKLPADYVPRAVAWMQKYL